MIMISLCLRLLFELKDQTDPGLSNECPKFSDYSQNTGGALFGVSFFPSFHRWVATNGTHSPMKAGSCSTALTRQVHLFFSRSPS